MKKKKLVYILLGLLIISLATAALVKYLSNTIYMDVSVESPMEIHFSDDTDYREISIYGGEIVSYETEITNKADQPIQVYYGMQEVTSPSVWQGNEFMSVKSDGIEELPCLYHVLENGDLLPFYDIASETVTTARLYVDFDCDGIPNRYTHPADTTVNNLVEITTNPAITPGMYSVKLCMLYDLTGEC